MGFVAAGGLASGVGSITPGITEVWVENDIFTLFVETNDAGVVDTPTGWTPITDPIVVAGQTKLWSFWRRATASESAPTVNDAGDHATGFVAVFRECKLSGSPIDVVATDTETTADTSASFPAVTTTGPDRIVVNVGADGVEYSGARASSWSNANLTDLIERKDAGTVAGDGGGLWMATGTKAAAGSTGNTTATLLSSAAKALLTFALIPSSISALAAESVSTSEAQDATVVVVVEAAESIEPVEAQAGGLVIQDGITEGVTLSDAQRVADNYAESHTESVELADTTAGGTASEQATTESISLIDSQSASNPGHLGGHGGGTALTIHF